MDKIKFKNPDATVNAVLLAVRGIAKSMDASPIKVYKFVHPQLLVPAICRILGIDEHEYADVIFEKVRFICRMCEIYGGLTYLYQDTDLPQKEEYARFKKDMFRVKTHSAALYGKIAKDFEKGVEI